MLTRILGYQLRQGMVVYRTPYPTRGEKPEAIGKPTGGCQKGAHFGNGCYDRIGNWYLYNREMKEDGR